MSSFNVFPVFQVCKQIRVIAVASGDCLLFPSLKKICPYIEKPVNTFPAHLEVTLRTDKAIEKVLNILNYCYMSEKGMGIDICVFF